MPDRPMACRHCFKPNTYREVEMDHVSPINIKNNNLNATLIYWRKKEERTEKKWFLFISCLHIALGIQFPICHSTGVMKVGHERNDIVFGRSSFLISFRSVRFVLRPLSSCDRNTSQNDIIIISSIFSGHVMCNNTCSSQALQYSQCAAATRFFFIAICLRKCDVVTCITKQKSDQQTSLSETEIIVGINGKN